MHEFCNGAPMIDNVSPDLNPCGILAGSGCPDRWQLPSWIDLPKQRRFDLLSGRLFLPG